MKLDWMLLAEGLGQDAKGAVTAIGLGQNVLVAPELPATTKRAILAHFTADGGNTSPGDKLAFRVSFISPSSKVLAAMSAVASVSSAPFPDLPLAVDVPAEIVLTCPEYGEYKFQIEIESPQTEAAAGEVAFYVRQPT